MYARTLVEAPVSFLSLRGGVVGFYDAGRLFNGSHDYGYQHAVGLGLVIMRQAGRYIDLILAYPSMDRFHGDCE